MDLVQIGNLLDTRRDGHCLPGGLYKDPQVFDFDLQVMYGTNWLMAGFTCELPKPGCYVALMIGKWPVIIIRDRNDVIRAFHNSCRHRGSILCQPGSGSGPKLVCPYHRWTYDLDGSLFAANRMADDFDKSTHGLKPIALETVAGAMFICFADEPPPIDDFAEKLAVYAAPHKWDEAKIAFQSVLVENANWKLVMENGRECYHCATGHPELARTFPVGMSKHFDVEGDADLAASAGLPSLARVVECGPGLGGVAR
jgi:Rieske 2Fe-2S family protein